MTTFGQMIERDGTFGNPTSIAFDAAGNMYITDGNIHIFKFDPSGNQLAILTNPGAQTLWGIAIDASGNIYTCDFQLGVIFKGNTVVATGLNGPIGISFDNSGRLLINDSRNNVIRVLDPYNNTMTILAGGDGSLQSGYQDGALANALFNSPVAAAIDQQSNIYVVDQGNYAVRKIVLH